MESNKVSEIKNLIGAITDYKTEISEKENEANLEGDKGIGNCTEKYFNEKLKFLLSAKNSYPKTTIEISKVLDGIILNMNYSVLKGKKLDTNKMNEIIRQINEIFEGETKIEIDSLFPFINGKQINKFFKRIDEFSYPKELKVDEDKDYTIIVGSTFSLKSQIIKKAEQLRKAFMLFSLLHNFYQIYPEYLEGYYKLFIKNNFHTNESDAIDLSSCGNYIFLIVTNKEFKSFKEQEDFTINLCYDQNNIDKSLEKVMKINNINKKQKNVQVINENLKNAVNKNTPNIKQKISKEYKSKINVKTHPNQVIHVNMQKRIQMEIKGHKNINERIIKKKNNNILNKKKTKHLKILKK